MLKPPQIWKERPRDSFTKNKYRKPQSDMHSAQFYDDGKCEVCGQSGKDLLIHEAFPRMCKDCYNSVRVYKTCSDILDKLGLKKKRDLTVPEMKKIVNFVKGLASMKHIPIAIFIAGLLGTLGTKNR